MIFYFFIYGKRVGERDFYAKMAEKSFFLKNHYSLLVVITVTSKYALSRFLTEFYGVLFG